DGGAYVAWYDDRVAVFGVEDIYAQHLLTDGSRDTNWPVDGLPVCTEASHQQKPTIIADGSGGAFVAWEDRRGAGSTYDIYAHHLLPSGLDAAWPTFGRQICGAAGDQTLPIMARDL